MNTKEVNLTDIILTWSQGDKFSEDKLFAATYQKFKELARQTREKSNFTEEDKTSNLIHSTTSLVHEAYLKLSPNINETIESRKQFYLLVSKVMRHILIDHFRKSAASKRQSNKAEFDIEVVEDLNSPIISYIEIDSAISKLSKSYPRQAESMQLKYFYGLRNRDIADLHQISESSVDKDLRFSKSWIQLNA